MKRYLAFLLVLFAAVGVRAQSLRMEAPSVVATDEPFRVVFTADGKITDFEWAPPAGLTLMWGPSKGTSSNLTIINGKRESSETVTYTYLLSADTKGTYTIPAATCKVKGTEVSSGTAVVEVVDEAPAGQSAGQSQQGGQASQGGGQSQQQQPSQGAGAAQSDPSITGTVPNEDIFMRLNLSKTSAVKGEPLTAVLKLYTRADIAGFEDFKLPTFNGFWSKETYAPNNLEFNKENINGKIYNTTVIRRYMLIPQQEGVINIEPAEAVCQLRVRANNGRARSIFDDFFDSYQTIRKRVSTGSINVHVNPLPAGAPASFGGGVGQFTITARFANDSIAANEASSLIVTVSGKGNVTMLSAPKISFPSEFDVYDVKTTDRSDGSGVTGSKVFEYPFIARSYGDFTIGPIKYSYYDISKGSYVTTEAPAVTIKVSSDGAEQGASDGIGGGVRQSVRNIGSDIRYIATGSPALRKEGSFFVTSWPFYAILAAIVALFFIVGAAMSKARERRADVAGMRNRRANKIATERLRRSKDYLKQGLVGAYYEELHKAVMGYVSDKLSMPGSDLSKDNISEQLAARGVPQATIDSLMGIIAICEAARYAPDYTPEQMENQYKDALDTITAIESGVKRSAKGARGATVAVALLFALSLSFNAAAAGSQAWEQAAQAYSSGDYQAALDAYLDIEQSGLVSDKLYYNIANSYYKTGALGESILYYEKALKLNPSYDDAKFNLAIARESVLDRIEVVPEFILVKWIRDIKYLLSSNAWAWVALALMVLVALALLGFRFLGRRGSRTLSFVLACVLFLLSVSAWILALSERHDIVSQKEAIVMLPVSSVKSSPGEDGKALFILHEGTKVCVLDSVGNWLKVQISDGRQGWIPAADIARI
ncbi:MAG: BatD family protein [Bacteroidales bacterium]|nr:BatD family protein [Bacteroidales bacterium]